METAQIMEKMISISDGNIHDIDHFIRVWTYAKTIGELEGLDSHTQKVLETAAIIHDIGCPICRKKYGNTNGKYQEKEGAILAEQFLTDFDFSKEDKERIVYLVAHHHTFDSIDGIDYQILMEADYIANASENGYSKTNIQNFMKRIMKTESAIRLTAEIFDVPKNESR